MFQKAGRQKMNDLQQLTANIIKVTVVGALILAMIFFFFFKSDFMSLVIGLLFGVLISILGFVDLRNTLERSVNKPPAEAQSYTIRKYFIRYIVNGVCIYVAVVTPHIHIVSTVLGMLLIKISIMITNLFNDKQFYKNILKGKEV
jgi:MFS superfamily sulfate permease-like transporter